MDLKDIVYKMQNEKITWEEEDGMIKEVIAEKVNEKIDRCIEIIQQHAAAEDLAELLKNGALKIKCPDQINKDVNDNE